MEDYGQLRQQIGELIGHHEADGRRFDDIKDSIERMDSKMDAQKAEILDSFDRKTEQVMLRLEAKATQKDHDKLKEIVEGNDTKPGIVGRLSVIEVWKNNFSKGTKTLILIGGTVWPIIASLLYESGKFIILKMFKV